MSFAVSFDFYVFSHGYGSQCQICILGAVVPLENGPLCVFVLLSVVVDVGHCNTEWFKSNKWTFLSPCQRLWSGAKSVR